MFASALTPSDERFTVRHMLPKLDTPSVFELDLGDYSAYGASIVSGRHGTTFTVTIGPISDATVATLDDLAHKRATICLYCRREPLLFDLVAVARKEPRKAVIEGRILGIASYARNAC
jgi:hypothetical protein